MSDQLIYFQEYISKIKQHFGEEKVKFILDESVFLVVSSSNDLAETYLVRSVEFDRDSYAEYLAEMASKFIKVSFPVIQPQDLIINLYVKAYLKFI